MKTLINHKNMRFQIRAIDCGSTRYTIIGSRAKYASAEKLAGKVAYDYQYGVEIYDTYNREYLWSEYAQNEVGLRAVQKAVRSRSK